MLASFRFKFKTKYVCRYKYLGIPYVYTYVCYGTYNNLQSLNQYRLLPCNSTLISVINNIIKKL